MQVLSIKNLFHALISVNNAVDCIAGIDAWRKPTQEIRLQDFDEELAQEIPYAPSKKAGNSHSVWSQLHFGLVLPALKNLAIQAENTHHLQQIKFSAIQAQQYFRFIDELRRHIKVHNEWVVLMGDLAKEIDRPEDIVRCCEEIASKKSDICLFLKAAVFHLPESPTQLFNCLRQLRTGINRENNLQLWKTLLSYLPPAMSDLHPQLAFFIKQAAQNNIIGRILQSYYADQYGYDYEKIGIPPQAYSYYTKVENSQKIPTLHQRILSYFCQELFSCPISTHGDVSALEIIRLYGSWYRKPSIVEMITPSFAGAAEEAALRVVDLLEHIYAVSQRKIDLRSVAIPTDHIHDDDVLRQIGRLTMVMDSVAGSKNELGTATLYQLVFQIWTEEQRKKVWGSCQRYFPGEWQTSQDFCRDVATLFYACALYHEDHCTLDKDDICFLKNLAHHIQQFANKSQVREIIHANRERIIGIARKKQHSSLEMLCMLFAIYKPQPVAITMREILRGIDRIAYKNGIFSFACRENKRKNIWQIAIDNIDSKLQIAMHNKPIVVDTITYPDGYELCWPCGTKVVIPKIGRESYDLMGRSGSAHAGEVIGFGCSVFHTTLQFIQLLAAAIGADYDVLEQIRQHMFSLNPQFHHRSALAEYQAQQIICAVYEKKSLSYVGWIRQQLCKNADFLDGKHYNHTRKFISALEKNSQDNFDYYAQRLRSLVVNNYDLYPRNHQEKTAIPPRISFYDGTTVDLPQNIREIPHNLLDLIT